MSPVDTRGDPRRPGDARYGVEEGPGEREDGVEGGGPPVAGEQGPSTGQAPGVPCGGVTGTGSLSLGPRQMKTCLPGANTGS